jgi:HlyD family secretion protein
MRKSKHFLRNFGRGIKAHKGLTIFLALVILIGGYQMVKAAKAGSAAPQYTISPAIMGSIVQTVSGTGQVAAANQLDVTSQASGAVTSIRVAVGDHVAKGQLLATIDDTSARNSLLSAKLQYAQLVEPPKEGDVTNATNAVQKAYSDAMSSVRSAFTDLQTVVPGMNSLLYDQAGYLGTANSVYLTTSGASYRTATGVSFDAAKNSYQAILKEYAAVPTNPATSTERQLVSDTHAMLAKMATALKDAQAAITYITANETQYQVSGASTARSNVASWLSLINTDVSSLGNADDTITSSENTLTQLIQGPDALQVQSSELSVQQAQNSYDNYFVRAPFDGIVGRIPVNLYAPASGSTVIATIVGDQKIANISLDEVDAAKVRTGQEAQITFDAINNFVATGTVSQVDLVGTVSSGVVSYNVRILINTQDERIRPGMSMNVTITTERKDDVLTVPTAAVKTLNGQSYVQVLDYTPMRQTSGENASTTRQFNGQFASSTHAFGSTTRMFSGGTGRGISFTVPSTTTPRTVPVTIGLSDDQNTEIVSGLERGQFVITRTSTGSGTAAASAPSILGAFGGQRAGGAQGAARTTGGNATFRAGGGGTGAVRIGG